MTGTPLDDERWCSPEYWVEQVEKTVRFADAVEWAASQGVSAVVEVGPGGGLAAVAARVVDGVAAGLLRSERDEQTTLLTALARLYVHGVPVDWAPLFAGGRRVGLPTYAFQRERFWPRIRAAVDEGLLRTDHPLLGVGVELPASGGVVFTARASLSSCPWLADHVVMGSVVFPGAGFLELVVRAADQVGCGRVEELTLHTPLVLPEHGGVDVQVVVDGPDDGGEREVQVFARSEQTWVRHASGVVSDQVVEPEAGTDPGADAATVDLEGFYAHAAEAGFGYGPVFQGLKAARRTEDAVFAEVALPVGEHATAAEFALHPALLDAALHAVWFAGLEEAQEGRLPFSWRGVSVHAGGATAARVRLRRTRPDSVSLVLEDTRGDAIASVESLVLRRVSADTLTDHAQAVVGDSLFDLRWTPLPVTGRTSPPARADAEILAVRGEGADVPEATHRVVCRRPGRAAAVAGPAPLEESPCSSPPAGRGRRGRGVVEWRRRRCGVWCGVRSRSIRAGSFWSTPTTWTLCPAWRKRCWRPANPRSSFATGRRTRPGWLRCPSRRRGRPAWARAGCWSPAGADSRG